ncbi:hypothetical protein Poly30_26950 [Planctomycetes bacterium Poly30]|uniref:Uncharacterized protein n=1 Tax=Saltatorellus ferox TaxID=2528018 RepID=A0A518ESW3_9BACT|nr:hypothetical protein Poly30_26950 [Planctomycetes bacterium Poly30]
MSRQEKVLADHDPRVRNGLTEVIEHPTLHLGERSLHRELDANQVVAGSDLFDHNRAGGFQHRAVVGVSRS